MEGVISTTRGSVLGRLAEGVEITRLCRELRRRGGALAADNFFRGLSRLGRLHPAACPKKHGVEVIRDLPYLPTGAREHTLDVYRPIERSGTLPSVLYVHGGGFRTLSKESHWLMALAFARRGFVVFNINYRLAPKNRYPAAIEDACAAYDWVVRNAARHGGDADRLILAGESAGANLVTALAVASSWMRPEPWAREVYDSSARPAGVIAACGILQVSDPQRFIRRRRLPVLVWDRIREVSEAYLGEAVARGVDLDLADPLCVIERGGMDRPLPPFLAFAGTKDPLLDDTRRLHAALQRLGSPCELRYYPKEIHAFHALIWRRNAILCWKECLAFAKRSADSAVAKPAVAG